MTRIQQRQTAWMPTGITLEHAALTATKSHGQTLIVAGPGAGKTELLAQRACYLLQTGTCPPPYRILAISFKREAAENLKARVILRCGRELGARLDSMTFDAFGKDLLDRFRLALPSEICPSRDYEIIAGADASDESLRKRMVGLSDAHCPLPTALRHQIGAAELRIGTVAFRLPFSDWPKENQFRAGRSLWRGLLSEAPSRLTFAMVNRLAEFLVRTNPPIRAALCGTYRFVFLDEFQDTTTAQCELTETCFHGSKSVLTAVGDTKQRIMGWAGALPGVFQRFRKQFGADLVPLTHNHRSRSFLVDVQSVFAAELDPETCPMVTMREGDAAGECRVLEFANESSEAIHLTKIILELLHQEIPAEEVCILCRTRPDQFAGAVIKKLKEAGLKVKLDINRRETLAEPAVGLLLDMLALVFASNAPDAWDRVTAVASELAGDADEAAAMRTRKRLLRVFHAQKSRLQNGADTKEEIHAALTELLAFIGRERFAALHPQYSQGGYLDKVIDRLSDLIVDELAETDWRNVVDAVRGIGAISVMTMHKSKGLEFDTVVFLGLEDNSIWNYQKNSEEETCGLFVALSRAKERCYFTYCRRRADRFGSPQIQSRHSINRIYELFANGGVDIEQVT